MLVARMGILFSCPADYYDPMEEGILEPSASSGGLRALDSSKLLIQWSLSFKRAQLDDNYPSSLQVETEISIKTADIAAIAPDSSPATVVPLVQRALAMVMYTDGGLGRGEPKARGGGDVRQQSIMRQALKMKNGRRSAGSGNLHIFFMDAFTYSMLGW
ncbi:uncharacterized protein [Lolium perenne]|uniref:uncharacterized protein n=1 Tax=Lolium perenne TaxID=4522 RepID=UPI003A995274